MILITTALMCEAKPLIAGLGLKRVPEETRWELFGNGEDIFLVVTGVGPVACAAAVSSILTRHGLFRESREEDFVLNIGTCCDPAADEAEFGSIYLINRLTDGETGRDYYPDMPNDLGLKERALVSVAKPVKRDVSSIALQEKSQNCVTKAEQPAYNTAAEQPLYDMEAAFLYQTVKYFLGPDRMAFVKIVSDNGISSEEFSPAELGKKLEAYVGGQKEKLLAVISTLHAYDRTLPGSVALTETDEKLFTDIRATQSMENRLKQLIKYVDCAGLNYRAVIEKMYAEGILPVKNKKDGIAVIDRIESELIR